MFVLLRRKVNESLPSYWVKCTRHSLSNWTTTKQFETTKYNNQQSNKKKCNGFSLHIQRKTRYQIVWRSVLQYMTSEWRNTAWVWRQKNVTCNHSHFIRITEYFNSVDRFEVWGPALLFLTGFVRQMPNCLVLMLERNRVYLCIRGWSVKKNRYTIWLPFFESVLYDAIMTSSRSIFEESMALK